jgi:hypothetical protein
MDYNRLQTIEKRKQEKQKKYREETDLQKRKRIFLEIQILDMKSKIERLR